MCGVELTGLIFAAIAVAWLAYLVPLYLRSRDAEQVSDDPGQDQFADSMRVITRGTAPVVDHAGAPMPGVEVSAPLTRRAAVRDLRRLEVLAASRRRRVLVTLMALTTAILVVCALGYLPWPVMIAPALLVVGFVAVARISVRVMKRSLDERFAAIMACSDESTVFLERVAAGQADEKSVGLQLKAPVHTTRALWDPLPITVPTYVSKPLAPRTVRTIDLSGPDAAAAERSADAVPVTADGPMMETVEQPDTTVAPVPVEERESAQQGRESAELRRDVG